LQLHDKLNAPSSKIRNRLLRISADSPDLLAVIKEGGKA
jgi:adenine-specific DNA-methyltransferase